MPVAVGGGLRNPSAIETVLPIESAIVPSVTARVSLFVRLQCISIPFVLALDNLAERSITKRRWCAVKISYLIGAQCLAATLKETVVCNKGACLLREIDCLARAVLIICPATEFHVKQVGAGLNKRVVVTGIGVLAANGIGIDEFWRTLLAGESGIAPITLFDASEHHIKIAGEVKNFDLKKLVPFPVKPKRMGRHTQLALAASWMALEDAGLDSLSRSDHKHEISLCLGVSTNAMDVVETAMDQQYMRDVSDYRTSPIYHYQIERIHIHAY